MIQIHISPIKKQSTVFNFQSLLPSVSFNYILLLAFFLFFIISALFLLTFSSLESSAPGSALFSSGLSSISTFFYPSWAIEFKTMTDIETLAIGIAVAYPTALYLIGLALWAVLIGIISITKGSSMS